MIKMDFPIKINKIVIWGLRKRWHTHRFIHKAFYENAKKLGYKVVWVEDEKENQKYIESGDLIITADAVGRMCPEKFKFEDYNLPIRDDVFYCMHNVKDIFTNKIRRERLLNIEVYHNACENKCDSKLGPVTFFDSKTSTLYQPWGTDLLAEQFKKPVFNRSSLVFWVGSIWNDKNNFGNRNEISDLKHALEKHKLIFIPLRFIPDWLNILLMRISRIAPAISGKRQVDTDYLPCRVFKNISYGQLGITNVKKFKDLFGTSFVEGENVDDLISNALSLNEKEYKERVLKQQQVVKDFTYKQALENIINCFSLIK